MRLDYSPFFRTTVGFDRLLDLLDQAEGAPRAIRPTISSAATRIITASPWRSPALPRRILPSKCATAF